MLGGGGVKEKYLFYMNERQPLTPALYDAQSQLNLLRTQYRELRAKAEVAQGKEKLSLEMDLGLLSARGRALRLALEAKTEPVKATEPAPIVESELEVNVRAALLPSEKDLTATQRAVLGVLKQGGKYTVVDILRMAHTTEARKVISDLRGKGWNIGDQTVTEGKKTFKKYFLHETN